MTNIVQFPRNARSVYELWAFDDDGAMVKHGDTTNPNAAERWGDESSRNVVTVQDKHAPINCTCNLPACTCDLPASTTTVYEVSTGYREYEGHEDTYVEHGYFRSRADALVWINHTAHEWGMSGDPLTVFRIHEHKLTEVKQ